MIVSIWGNFLISGHRKQLFYQRQIASQFFWRTRQQQEIDNVETRDGKVFGFEFKWNPKRPISFSKTFPKPIILSFRE
ncbi:MAG: hypothetical protein IPF68_12920 [Bacteroidales bacterium]|nr:hypothetical protein [Bacteroidales bacterium]